MRGSLASRTGSALLWNGAGLAVTRLISLVRFVVLARLLTPEDFGLLAIAWVVIELLLTLTDTGMVTALVQRDRVDESQYDTAWTVGIVRALVVAIVLVVGAPLIAQFFGEPRAASILPPLAAAPVLAALASIKIADLTRNLQFRKLTFIRVPEAAVEAVVSIALATLLGVWRSSSACWSRTSSGWRCRTWWLRTGRGSPSSRARPDRCSGSAAGCSPWASSAWPARRCCAP